MRLVLDTHAVIWTAERDDTHRLGARAREAIDDRSKELLVSTASAWEIATKHRRGRLPAGERLIQNWSAIVRELAAHELPVTSEHGLLAGGFDADRRDPFDRMLAAQAIIEGAQLVTADPAMRVFGADILW